MVLQYGIVLVLANREGQGWLYGTWVLAYRVVVREKSSRVRENGLLEAGLDGPEYY